MKLNLTLGVLLIFCVSGLGQTKKVDYSKKIKAYILYLKKDPKNYYMNMKVAYLYSLTGKYTNAEYHYLAAIKSKNSSIEARLGLCLVYAYLQKEKDVEKLCRLILRVDKYNYYAHIYLAGTLQRQIKFKESEAVLKKIIKVYPADTTLLTQLRDLYTAYSKTREAESVNKLLGLLSQ